MSEETFIYEKTYSIDESVLSKVSSSNTLRSLIDRFFREASVFSDFRFEDKIDNYWKHFYEEFIEGGRIEGATLKSWNRFFLDIDFI